VFTARYALSPYIKQIRFAFKGLTEYPKGFISHGYFELAIGVKSVSQRTRELPLPRSLSEVLQQLTKEIGGISA
jgi:hypothetical protein